MATKPAQITYRQEQKTPVQSTFPPVQISSPLGGIKGGEDKNYRKPKSIPAARRLTLGNDRLFKNSKNRVTNADRINKYAIRVALDYLNRSYHFENKKIRTVEDVTSHLFSILFDKLKPEYQAERGMKGVMTVAMVERYSERAAEFAVDVWRPDYFEIQARKGAKGGKKSKRKPEFSYAEYQSVDGLTHPEAAAMLGKSISTVRRMRDKFDKPEPVSENYLPKPISGNYLPEDEPVPPVPGIDLDELIKTL